MNSLHNQLNSYHHVCWYPSAGNDFMAFRHWYSGKGNTLKPDCFVYTDQLYRNIYNLNQYENNDLNIDIPMDVFKEYPSDETGFSPLLNEDQNAWVEKYITDNIDLICKEPDRIELFKMGFYDEELIKDFHNYIVHNIDFLVSNEQIKTQYKNGAIHINMLYPYLNKNNGNYRFFKTDKADICLVSANNQYFVDYCLVNNVSISGIMINRPVDDYILDVHFQKNVLRDLGVKECIVNPNYFSGISEFEEFSWYEYRKSTDRGSVLSI
jgi:hypothetical protein